MGIADDLKKAFFEGYEAGKKDAEFYMLHCGDETPVSNGDKIRSMTDEELAHCLFAFQDRIKYEDWLDWLKKEVRDDKSDMPTDRLL